MCTCALACETMPGANAVKAAPTVAAKRLIFSVRANSRYQPIPVAARLAAMTTAKLTGAPNANVTGAMRAPSRMSEALHRRFTPSGAFNSGVTRWKSPLYSRVPWARNHSSSAWSFGLRARARRAGSGQRPLVSHTA